MKDWVHEDDVLDEAGVSRRIHCGSEASAAQISAMDEWFATRGHPDSVMRLSESAE